MRPRNHSASVRPEPRDTLFRDKRLTQYAAKERCENANEGSGLHASQFNDADPTETGVRFSSQAGILRVAGHGWVPYPDMERRSGHRPYARSESRRTPYQQRVYGSFVNPSRLPREEYNDGNFRGANSVRTDGEPMLVTTPYGGETDDKEGRPIIATSHARPEEVGEQGRDKRVSHRDGYEFHHRADYNDPPQCAHRVPHHSSPRLAKIDSYSDQGSESLEGFFDQVKEYTTFYGWDRQEACCQVCAHLKYTALSYVKRALFAPCSWEKILTTGLDGHLQGPVPFQATAQHRGNIY